MSPRNGNEADVPVITSESDDNTFRLLQMAAGGPGHRHRHGGACTWYVQNAFREVFREWCPMHQATHSHVERVTSPSVR